MSAPKRAHAGEDRSASRSASSSATAPAATSSARSASASSAGAAGRAPGAPRRGARSAAPPAPRARAAAAASGPSTGRTRSASETSSKRDVVHDDDCSSARAAPARAGIELEETRPPARGRAPRRPGGPSRSGTRRRRTRPAGGEPGPAWTCGAGSRARPCRWRAGAARVWTGPTAQRVARGAELLGERRHAGTNNAPPAATCAQRARSSTPASTIRSSPAQELATPEGAEHRAQRDARGQTGCRVATDSRDHLCSERAQSDVREPDRHQVRDRQPEPGAQPPGSGRGGSEAQPRPASRADHSPLVETRATTCRFTDARRRRASVAESAEATRRTRAVRRELAATVMPSQPSARPARMTSQPRLSARERGWAGARGRAREEEPLVGGDGHEPERHASRERASCRECGRAGAREDAPQTSATTQRAAPAPTGGSSSSARFAARYVPAEAECSTHAGASWTTVSGERSRRAVSDALDARAAPAPSAPRRGPPRAGSRGGRAPRSGSAGRPAARPQERVPHQPVVAGPRQRGAVEAAPVLLLREREELVEGERRLPGARHQLGIGGRAGSAVPGADRLAVVAAEDPAPEPRRDLGRDLAAPLDGPEREAAARVHEARARGWRRSGRRRGRPRSCRSAPGAAGRARARGRGAPSPAAPSCRGAA